MNMRDQNDLRVGSSDAEDAVNGFEVMLICCCRRSAIVRE